MSTGCVRCGRCQTTCPTYRLTQDEKTSSRGRLALITALKEGRLKESAAYRRAMTACLLCGACERTCANSVKVREHVLEARKGLTGGLKRLALAATENPARLDRAAALARKGKKLAGQSGLVPAGHIPEDSGLHLRFGSRQISLPPLAEQTLEQEFPQAYGPAEGEAIILFPGCMATYSMPEVGRATILSLAGAGYRVHLPRGAGCCGLPASAAGLGRLAEKRAEENARALADKISDLARLSGQRPKVAFLCASCHHRLSETLPNHWPDTSGPLPTLLDLPQALAGRLPKMAEIPERATFHDPCHSLGPAPAGAEAIDRPALARDLMAHLPGLEFVESNQEPSCCGSGGLFSLSFPEMSKKIGEAKAEKLTKSQAQLAATTCPACLLRLRELAEKSGFKARHLAELVAERIA